MVKKTPYKIVVTGAESTGKSTLAEGLAEHFGAQWLPEIARTFVESLNRPYNYDDIEQIARMQIDAEKKMQNDTALVFFDTWLIITKVWFDFVYGHHPAWLHQSIQQSKIDLFLLCDIDLPWIADPVRENGGVNRIILQERYRKEIEFYGFKYCLISGIETERIKNAISEVESLLRS